MVGQSLVTAAGVQATISQIGKYNTAANAFREKYGYLPGDIKDPEASSFGFQARGPYQREGDGNWLIEGITGLGAGSYCGFCSGGETAMFWIDLSQAQMIDATFNSAYPTMVSPSSTGVRLYYPAAKIGRGNYIYVWGTSNNGRPTAVNGLNYFGVSAAYKFSGWPMQAGD